MKLIFCNLISIILILYFYAPLNVSASSFTFVDTTQQIYSYDSMVEDLTLLTMGHEDILSFASIATTSQGRSVWLVKLGNPNAEKKILITASIHSREYMTSQLVMRMLEEYVLNIDTPQADGISYRQLLNAVCFYILPMVNPDGVSISQFGVNGASQEATINWLLGYQNQGINLTQIKANANGVDLNRNFPLGFGLGNRVSGIPSLSYFPGFTPLSEPESQAMAILLNENIFSTCINYHSMGNVIYYGASTNSPDVAIGCKNLAHYVGDLTGYRREYCGSAIGSFADYFGTVEKVPSITIEIGTANPVPISQFSNIYNRNVNVWSAVARYIYAQ